MSLWKMTDEEASKPKYLSDTLRNGQSVSDLDATVGIDTAEKVNVASAQHAGWVTVRSYTDAQGNARTKSETLVAAGSMTGDNDTIAPEITIGTQPTNQSVTAPAAATFTVAATRTGTGTLTYLWQVSIDDGATWATATGAVATEASFTIDPTDVGMDGHQYRCVVSLVGAQSVTSSAATLTVTE